MSEAEENNQASEEQEQPQPEQEQPQPEAEEEVQVVAEAEEQPQADPEDAAQEAAASAEAELDQKLAALEAKMEAKYDQLIAQQNDKIEEQGAKIKELEQTLSVNQENTEAVSSKLKELTSEVQDFMGGVDAKIQAAQGGGSDDSGAKALAAVKELESILANVLQKERHNLPVASGNFKEGSNSFSLWPLSENPQITRCPFGHKDLLCKTISEMRALQLQRVDFLQTTTISSLTFVFTDKVRCPPKGSYNPEPTHKFELPSSAVGTIGGIDFGTNEYDQLNSVKISNRKSALVAEIRGSHDIHNTQSLVLNANEHIVSASVELEGEMPHSVKFLLFTE